MPRIRNWKSLHLYKTDSGTKYQHIDSLFERSIDWELIRLHWRDLMQVVISIQAGKVLPSFMLQKLGGYGRKTKLYKAFRELGRVKRTLFLLRYISDADLQQSITKSTNKIESFNSFCDWITFGGETIMSGDPIEQEKRVKYTTLIANAIMLHNIEDLTNVILELKGEGYPVDNKLLSYLSPYMNEHIRRFGYFVLNQEDVPEPMVVGKIT